MTAGLGIMPPSLANAIIGSIWLAAAAFVVSAGPADAGEPRTTPSPLVRRHADPHIRAGCPQCVSRYAQPTRTPEYVGYYVGGGAARDGEPRYPHEGTWGWDYGGRLFPKRIMLNWWHGERSQGGTGAYKTEGPKILPRRE
jgi:hypothetical protein